MEELLFYSSWQLATLLQRMRCQMTVYATKQTRRRKLSAEVKVFTIQRDTLNGVTSPEFRDAVIFAMEIWNEQPNSVYLEYAGTTTATGVSDCRYWLGSWGHLPTATR